METAMAAAATTRQPLLGNQDSAELDPERGILVEGSNVTISEVAADVQGALLQHPREAIKWIEEYGCTRLGSFRIHVSIFSLANSWLEPHTFFNSNGRGVVPVNHSCLL